MPINKLKQNAVTILNQIADLVTQINDNHYSQPLDLLSGNTLAKHIRHILELYVQLISGIDNNEINYDKRERNLLIEHNKTYTIDFIKDLIVKINLIENKEIQITLNTTINDDEVIVKSSLERELVYNIEHAIHHMAIIQIACKHSFEYIKLDKNFGVAYATIQYNSACVQ
jgi:hypothetical protein